MQCDGHRINVIFKELLRTIKIMMTSKEKRIKDIKRYFTEECAERAIRQKVLKLTSNQRNVIKIISGQITLIRLSKARRSNDTS